MSLTSPPIVTLRNAPAAPFDGAIAAVWNNFPDVERRL